LRRAFGFKRSEARMKEVEVKLRRGMQDNGITGKTQDDIVRSIASFALYGFPESHAASFALIAYASAYLKCHYLAAFTAALLNNQPMGFYQPFTIIKDAQRHGLKVLPVDVTRSDWLCTLEDDGEGGSGWGIGGWGLGVGEDQRVLGVGDGGWGKNPKDTGREVRVGETQSKDFPIPQSHFSQDSTSNTLPPRSVPPSTYTTPPTPHPHALRLGLRYVKGMSAASGQVIERERKRLPFESIDDLHQRVPELRKDELRKLAAVGALNFIQTEIREISVCRDDAKDLSVTANDKLKFAGQNVHRRAALWQVERVARAAGPLFAGLHELDANSPLAQMTVPERMDADFRGTGLTIGRHPVAMYRTELNKLGATRAVDIQQLRNGFAVRVAGWVIVRQRPGTAKGFMFLTLEDETGVANVIITPQLFDKNRLVLVDHPFLLIEGKLQNQDNVVSLKAKRIRALSFKVAALPAHNFR